MSLLVAGGANVNATDRRGRTPLHATCLVADNAVRVPNGGTRQCVEFLLSSGALGDARDEAGQTPLHLAARGGVLGAAEALVGAGATGMADDAQNTPLHLAAAQGHVEIMQLLVLGSRESNFSSSLSVDKKPAATSTKQRLAEEARSSCMGEGLAKHKEDGETINSERAPTSMQYLADGSSWKAFETSEGYTYYRNDVTGVSSWELPATSTGGPTELPAHASYTRGGVSVPELLAETDDLSGRSITLGTPTMQSSVGHDNRQTLGGQEGTVKRNSQRRAPPKTAQIDQPKLRLSREDGRASYGRRSGRVSKDEKRNTSRITSNQTSTNDRVPLTEKNTWGGRSQAEFINTLWVNSYRDDADQDEREAHKPEIWNNFLDNSIRGPVSKVSRDLETTAGMDPIVRACKESDQPRRRPSSQGDRRHRRSRRRDGSDGIAWPGKLSPEEYHEVKDTAIDSPRQLAKPRCNASVVYLRRQRACSLGY